MDQQKPSSSSTKSKNTIMKFLPKPTSSVSFQNHPIYSPARDKRLSEKPHKSNLGIGLSGPMVSMILADTRRQSRNNGVIYEPTSPRVSCMGQVKCKNRNKNKNKKLQPQPTYKVSRVTDVTRETIKETKPDAKSGKKLGFKKIFSGITVTPSDQRRSDSEKKDSMAPSLGTMKRFSSGRGKFSSYDWTKEVAAMDSGDRRYDSNEESDLERVVVPSSAPVIIRSSLGFEDNIIRVAGISTEPRNEINLWKRRTMKQPKPLSIT
ncbi:uncharacterized protein At1g76070-like [Bidens hawaiensis]|uniref:uncharacterized protein At1g76070-like n=1 Tax=Bidens hawaiensis TaxID=980011 RepID=UPI00404ADB1D